MAVDTYFGSEYAVNPGSANDLRREKIDILRRAGYFQDKAKPAKQQPGDTGGGGGGVRYITAPAPDPAKPYLNYYTRYLNISPNMKLVNKAKQGKYTMTEFALLVQREDTARFLRTWKGQEVAENFRQTWARIFPSLSAQPGMKAMKKFLQQEPSKDYGKVTNPSSLRAMYQFLSGTKLFQRVYPEFGKTLFAQTLNFAGYRKEKQDFTNIMRQYTGVAAEQGDVSYFFNSKITAAEFEKNLQTMLAGQESYQYATGQSINPKVQRAALYGREDSAKVLSKIAAAYQQQNVFQKSRQAEYLTQREQETGRITTQLAY